MFLLNNMNNIKSIINLITCDKGNVYIGKCSLNRVIQL